MRQTYLPNQNAYQRGFTLTELIMVIVVLGILAVFAAPRMFNTGDFYARGFHDETLALLRYAQKTAIAQRRTVCVTFNADSATLSIASLEGAASPCNTALSGPNQNCTSGTPIGSKGCITARAGISYSNAPASLNFNGLGQPSPAPPIQIINSAAAAGNPIVVETETGYVHD